LVQKVFYPIRGFDVIIAGPDWRRRIRLAEPAILPGAHRSGQYLKIMRISFGEKTFGRSDILADFEKR
jgi:hypothetical protein